MIIEDRETSVDAAMNPYAFMTEIAGVDEKIQCLMQKIRSTNEELREVSAQLQMSDLVDGVDSLLVRKDALERLRKANHNCLSYYERRLEECEKPHLKLIQRHNYELLTYRVKEMVVQDEIVSMPDRSFGVRLGRLAPLGVGKNRKVMENQKRAQEIFNRAMACSEIKDLYIEAMLTPDSKTGAFAPWLLLLLDGQKIVPDLKECGAACSNTFRSIMVNSDLSDDEILSAFVFELTNAVSSSKTEPFFNAAIDGTIDIESFTMGLERVEHEGSLRHHEIMKVAIEKMGWSSSMDVYANMPRNFDAYWHVMKDGDHANLYRRDWLELAREREHDEMLSYFVDLSMS